MTIAHGFSLKYTDWISLLLLLLLSLFQGLDKQAHQTNNINLDLANT